MTQSLAPAAPAVVPAGPSRSRRLLRAAAVVSCLPYLGLKAAWIAGSHVGIPDGSPLLDHRVAMAVANGLSVLLDSCVIVLALVLTRPWGLRVPPWLLAFPVWTATGLLAPIMAGYPLQLLVRVFVGDVATASGPRREPFLHEWVFGVVYGGFIVQGLALGALFVLYARDRWGHLWRGRVWDLPASVVGRGRQVTAVAAAVLALFPLAVRLSWACGGTAGLGAAHAADRTSDFHVLEGLYAAFLAVAVAGGLLLAFRRGRVLPVAVPLALTWVGSGAVACWGGWMLLVSLTGTDDPADRPTQLMLLTYAGQMIVGLLLAAVGAGFLARRSATAPKRP
ncbi:hypothetical protein H0H10_17415 [Streptomyces sp. TRM S81-3]|uniref:LigA protein n=1 Tax=Streptomyces griseicoloratus TaxID=2752516 RepID=A0A926L6B3_9ACTN|nr:hypothetical protein [Streptomyces griseicoloratus]MBD0420903.1 hypothetical protein [Streptomyces griseicoloratus]